MTGIWAKSILASQHATTGKRLDTVLVRFPRIILAECNTHGAIARNTASSRAIPVAKMIQQVETDPFIPYKWFKNKPGMQGTEEMNADERRVAIGMWLHACAEAVAHARSLVSVNAHKQIVNRLLEPWMWTIAVWSATEWDNFFKVRDHSAAEPHFEMLAKAIRKARDEAPVQILQPREWHLPFIEDDDWTNASDFIPANTPEGNRVYQQKLKVLKVLSVARCASTSYKTVDDFDMTIERARKIYDSLLGDPIHPSPFEHVAQADGWWTHPAIGWAHPEDHRRFRGFRQYRAFVEREAA